MNRFRLLIAGFFLFIFLPSCINSYKADLEKILNPGALPYLKDSKLIQVSSHDTTGGNNDMIMIPSGKEATILQVPGPGVITRIWFRIDSDDPYFLRRILIKMFWDNETDPSVEVPLGDFFGSGFAYRQYVTPYLGMSSGGYTCFFPMPFEDLAKIVIVNESPMELKGFYYQIDYQKLEAPVSTDIGYFHAYWHRDVITDYDSNYTILNTKGRGHVVGVNMSIQSYDRKFSFLDGDEQVFVDGEKSPSIHGTGTEDYFSSGWYFNKGEYAGPYNGLVLKDDSLGRISAYRFHIMDPISFKKSINFTIEHGYNNRDIADYSSTVYWYQEEPHVKLPAMSNSGLRIPIRIIPPSNLLEAEKLSFNLGKIRAKPMNMAPYGAEWGEGKQLFIQSGPSDEFSVTLNHLEENSYDIRLYYTKGPDYGNVDVYLGTEKIGQIKGYASFIQPGGFLSVSGFKNLYNSLTLQFKVVGKDSLSNGFSTGLDGIKLDPNRSFIQEWNVLGPFQEKTRTNGTRNGLDSIYPPDVIVDLDRIYTGMNGKILHWQVLKASPDGYVSFEKFKDSHKPSVYYAFINVHSTEPRLATLLIGSNEDIKVDFNYTKFTIKGSRILNPDQARTLIKINKGWNGLVLKIESKTGNAGFYARILDRENLFLYPLKQDLRAKNPETFPNPPRKKWKYKGF